MLYFHKNIVQSLTIGVSDVPPLRIPGYEFHYNYLLCFATIFLLPAPEYFW